MAMIGQIVVRMGADTRPLLSGLNSGGDAISRFASRANGIAGGAGMGAAALAGGVAGLASAGVSAAIGFATKAGGAILGAIDSASHLNETISKTGAIMGDAAGPVLAFADDMAAKFGLTKREVLDAAAGFGGLGDGLGKLGGTTCRSSRSSSPSSPRTSNLSRTPTRSARRPRP
jgi:hypothetical protein